MINALGKVVTKMFFHHPIFVVGAGRSGTTALLAALGKHPLIHPMLFESPFISHVGRLVYPLEFGEVKDYYIRALQIPKEHLYDSLRRLCFECAVGRNYGLKVFAKGLLRRDTSILKKRYWCAKTFPNLDANKGLTRLYPEVKFIYIVRNGCDVVQSRTRFRGFRDQEFSEHCRVWTHAAEKYRYLSDFESAIEVRHEQLVAQPEQFFRRIFDSIGLNHHEGPSGFARSTLLHPLDKETQVDVDVQKVFAERKPSYASWSLEQRGQFKSICGDAMRDLGYVIPF